jgi:hypothetical protein
MKVKTSKGRILTEKNAAGVSGMLCRSIDGQYFFRIYHGGGAFDDYDLLHDDISVTIATDELASFYEDENGGKFLDHSSNVFGWEKIEEKE